MNDRVVITGLGLITPLGNDLEQTWRALLAGERIRDHARLGHLSDTSFQLARESPALAESSCHSRATRLAIDAAQQAIADARWSGQIMADPETALVLGTSKGPVEKWISPPPRHIENLPYVVAGDGSLSFGLAEMASRVARRIGHGPGPRLTYSGACASGIHALIQAILLLRDGVARRALVVAAEASVHPLFIGSFNRLGVLPAENIGCRPFDVDRDGFLMSEAAAAICLELAERPGSEASVEIDRFALAADATHLTGSDPEGRALKHVLRQVVQVRPLDLIHAHATGTVFNDPIELEAIESVISPDHQPPNIWSHKGALGHSLGAAGLVSVVLNCMSHSQGVIPGNVTTLQPLATSKVAIASLPVQRTVRRSIALASGFGGALAAVSMISR